jgi:hypothetical protein
MLVVGVPNLAGAGLGLNTGLMVDLQSAHNLQS